MRMPLILIESGSVSSLAFRRKNMRFQHDIVADRDSTT